MPSPRGIWTKQVWTERPSEFPTEPDPVMLARSFHIYGAIEDGVAAGGRGAVRRAALAAAIVLAGCSDDSAPRKITQTREATLAPGSFHAGATSRERFGGDDFSSPHGGTKGEPTGQETKNEQELDYDLPAGWIELPPTDMRRVNLQPAGNADAECYLSVLPGAAGGVEANVNRWRKQFGLEESTAETLPTQDLLGLEAARVDLEGDFKATSQPGAPASAAKPGFALVGLIGTIADQTVFVKMTGPKEVVAAENASFDAWVKSLRLVAPGSASARRDVTGDAQLRFTAPPGWSREPDKAMRLATLKPAGTKSSECVIVVLPGEAGGVAGNVARWRGQMGLEPPSPLELAALPKISMLGTEAVVVDCVGRFDDAMSGRTIEQARFLGAIALVDGKAIFVKLTGPEAEVDGTVRDGFLALCASLAE